MKFIQLDTKQHSYEAPSVQHLQPVVTDTDDLYSH